MDASDLERASALPIIDIEPLRASDPRSVAAEIRNACLATGFFYIVGHGVDEALQARLEELSRRFFAQALETKLELRMERGG